MPSPPLPRFDPDQVSRLWLDRQGLLKPRGRRKLTKRALTDHLERTGALQLDSVNVVDRAHYLTLWSRFGNFDRQAVDRWVYRDRMAYEYWGHEASILPISHLPIGLRAMKRFPPRYWSNSAWWEVYQTTPASKRRVLRQLRERGPQQSSDFEKQPDDPGAPATPGAAMLLAKQDKRSLQLLWHAGKVAVHARRHFRRFYDLAERVYDVAEPATTTEFEDSWLTIGLSGNGIATEAHLNNYVTRPRLTAAERKRVIARNLRAKRIVQVRVAGRPGVWLARPYDLDRVPRLSEASGTTLICPFDSLLWQRKRAEDLLSFKYRVEIYVPEQKRQYGYYVLPIMHEGRLIGRLDPKLHRDRKALEIKSIHLESGFRRSRRFDGELGGCLTDLAGFLDAKDMQLPKGWRTLC